MTDLNRKPAEQPASSPDRDPLDVTDLPENEADASTVKGGIGLNTVRCVAMPATGPATAAGCTNGCSASPPASLLCR